MPPKKFAKLRMVICLGYYPEKTEKNGYRPKTLWCFLAILQFLVARSKVFSSHCDVVAGPLAGRGEDECVSTIFLQLCGGGAPFFAEEGRTILRKSRTFDCTMGFPGEDLLL